MDMELVKDLLDNDLLAKKFEEAGSTEEMQLIALLLIRNNVQTIKGWVVFFGVTSILAVIVVWIMMTI